ncbi:hypothetical protein [Riemerella columbina]|uniref:hypothetical protein n=1 Tax=Riemerella columbina TaxID=103810 RepID=UPI00036A37D6|nr:hypothetical protein [Riemerella columbina]
MEEKGYIEISVDNFSNTLSPEDVDINEIKELISNIENFLYPTKKEKNSRPHISYSLEEGCALHRFFISISGVLLFNGLTSEISKRQNLSFLSIKQQNIISDFQKKAIEKGYIIKFRSSLNPKKPSLIIDKDTSYIAESPSYYEGEFYLYGEIYQNGGKDPNIHVSTKDGNVTVYATKKQISEGDNKLYKTYGVKVKGKKNLEDGSFSDLKLIEFIEYQPIFNRSLLDKAIEKASEGLSKIKDLDKWIDDLKTEAI